METHRWIATALCLASGVAGAESVDLIVEHARLIDGTGRSPVEDATIVIANGRIQDVTLERPPTHARRVLDARGFTVVPGLVDAHSHLLSEAPSAPGSSLLDHEPHMSHRSPESVEDYIAHRLPTRLRRYLEAGVTTLVDLGSWEPYIFEVREKLSRGELQGPRLFVTGRIFTAPGGHPDESLCAGNPFCASVSVSTDDPLVAREAVDGLADRDVDGIKVVFDALDLLPFSEGYPKLRRDVLTSIIERAHAHGLPVVAHVLTGEDAVTVVEAGADALAHLPFLGLESARASNGKALLELLGERRIPIVPTVAVITPEDLPFPLGLLLRFSYWLSRSSAQPLRVNAVALVLGTDFSGNGPDPKPGAAVRRETETLVTLGFTEAEVIQMATGNAARFPLLPETLGTIRPGSTADLLLLPGDPLVDVRVLTAPTVVVKDGRIVVDERED